MRGRSRGDGSEMSEEGGQADGWGFCEEEVRKHVGGKEWLERMR